MNQTNPYDQTRHKSSDGIIRIDIDREVHELEHYSVRVYNSLGFAKINTIKDLIQLTEKDILSIKNSGVKTLNIIKNALERFGLRLDMSPKDIEKYLHADDRKYLEDLENIDKKYLAESNPKFEKISIPEELCDLPILSILLMSSQSNFFRYYGIIARIQHAFTELGELDGYSIDMLFQKKNIGRIAVKFFESWFEYFLPGSYKEIAEKFDYYSYQILSEINSSPYLKLFMAQYELNTISDIQKLDEIDFNEFRKLEKLCLLELRTLHIEKSNFITNSNVIGNFNLIYWIDIFMDKYCTDNWRNVLILKWNNENNTLEQVGNKLGVTRERIRQLITGKIGYIFNTFYMYDKEYIVKYFLEIIQNTLEPIKFKDINTSIYTPKYNENLYLGFLSNVFTGVPFWGYQSKSHRNKDVVRKEITILAKNPYGLELNDYLSGKHIFEILDFFIVMFRSKYHISKEGGIFESGRESLKFVFKGGKTYINCARISLSSTLLHTLETAIEPLSLNDICKILNNSHDNRMVAIHSVINTLNRIDEIVAIDHHIWGLQKHLSYKENEWDLISDDCEKILISLGHQSSASYLFRKMKKKYRRLVSKFELVYILRQSRKITYLGFHTFGLPKFGLKERVKISDIIEDLFKLDPRPKHNKEIYDEVIKLRTVNWAGHNAIMKQESYKLYFPGYYGLRRRHEQNIKDLLNDSIYVESYIRRIQNDTSIESISEYFNLDESEDLIEKINAIDNLSIVKDPYSEKLFVLTVPVLKDKDSNNHRLKLNIKRVLYNCAKPLTIEEIKYFCMVSPSTDRKQWYRQQSNLDKIIIKIIKDDDNYEILSNGSILYSVDKASNIELLEIKNEVIEYLDDLNQKVHIDILFELVEDLSDAINSKLELVYLLETDERIEIKENMVKFVDYS